MNDLEAGAIGEQALSKPAPMVRPPHVAKNYPPGAIPAAKILSLGIRHAPVRSLPRRGAFDKTTTLRMIAGLEAMNEGVLHFKDRPTVKTSPTTRQQDALTGLWTHRGTTAPSASRQSNVSVWRRRFPSSTTGFETTPSRTMPQSDFG